MATYQGRSQAIHVGGSGAAVQALGAHGWRVSFPGTQVVGAGATATVEFSTDAIADISAYWVAGTPNRVQVPTGRGGVYLLGADAATPSYVSGLVFEVFVDAGGDGEDPTTYAVDVQSLIHTRTPRGQNPLAGFYRVNDLGIVTLKVTNTTGSSVTLQKGSFTGVLVLPISSGFAPFDKIWRYLEGAIGHHPGFEVPSYDDSAWLIGGSPFTHNSPGFLVQDEVTHWIGVNDELTLRAHILLPSSVVQVKAKFLIDYSGSLWVNGSFVGSYTLLLPASTIDITSLIVSGDNVIAVRAYGDAAENIFDLDLEIH